MERTRSVLAAAMDDGRTLYRARFTKLTEIEAAAACETLKDKSVTCFVVSGAAIKNNPPRHLGVPVFSTRATVIGCADE